MIKQPVLIAGIVILALFCMADTAAAQDDTGNGSDGLVITDDIGPYNGTIGPGSPIYGLKIAFEDLDESFTTNESERFNKQLTSARLRLSEVKRELLLNNSADADRALDLYWQKTNMTRLYLQASAASNATSLLHAQEMVAKHQLVLANLMASHPNNTGLIRAYNNSLVLDEKFGEKTRTRFERVVQKNNATLIKAVRLDVREEQDTRNAGQNRTLEVHETRQVQQGTGNGKNDSKAEDRVTTIPASPAYETVRTAVTVAPGRETGDKGKGNSGTGNSASDNSRTGNNSNTGSSPVPGGTGSGKNR